MAYDSTRFTALQVPTVNQWNQIHDNTDALQDGSAIDAGAITGEKLGTPVAFRATPTGTASNLGAAAMTSYTEVFDLGDNFASGVFTAPYDGVYCFGVRGGKDNAASRIFVRLYVEGGGAASGFSTGASANHDPIAELTEIVSLTAGDEVTAGYGSETAGDTLTGDPSFWGYLIGRTD